MTYSNGNNDVHYVVSVMVIEQVFVKTNSLFVSQRTVDDVTVDDCKNLVIIVLHFFAICIDSITDMVKTFRLEVQSLIYEEN